MVTKLHEGITSRGIMLKWRWRKREKKKLLIVDTSVTAHGSCSGQLLIENCYTEPAIVRWQRTIELKIIIYIIALWKRKSWHAVSIFWKMFFNSLISACYPTFRMKNNKKIIINWFKNDAMETKFSVVCLFNVSWIKTWHLTFLNVWGTNVLPAMAKGSGARTSLRPILPVPFSRL